MSAQASKHSTSETIPQRVIRSYLSTREYAVLTLILFCIVVEFAILVVTQQYEANTAPAGTVLLLGMSAAGLVVFFAEVLKLPVAWASGVFTGWTRFISVVIACGLCVLTATTVKDIITREWDMSLKPARDQEEKAHAFGVEIEALEQKRVELATNSKDTASAWTLKLAETAKEISALQARKDAAQNAHRLSIQTVKTDSLSPTTKTQVDELKSTLATQTSAATGDIDSLRTELKEEKEAERTRRANDNTARESARVQERNDRRLRNESIKSGNSTAEDQYVEELKGFELAQKNYSGKLVEYKRQRDEINQKLEAEKERLHSLNRPFFDVEAQIKVATAHADGELAELKVTFERSTPVPASPIRPAPMPIELEPSSPNGELPDSSVANTVIAELQDRIQKKEDARNKISTDISDQITVLLASAQSTEPQTPAQKLRLQTLATELDALTKSLDAEMNSLLDRRNQEEIRRGETMRSPEAIEAELQAIPEQLRELKSKKVSAENESARLRTDTNAIRSASGVIRWFMPDTDPAKLEATAYGIYPVGIGLLIAFLPAVLLEIGVHSLMVPPAARRRSQWNLVHYFSRGRRALKLERGRAAAFSHRAQATQKEFEERRMLLEQTQAERTALLEKQRNAFNAEVETRLGALEQEVQTRAEALQSELVASRDIAIAAREEALKLSAENAAMASTAAQHTLDAQQREQQLLEQNGKLREDIGNLMDAVITRDAQTP